MVANAGPVMPIKTRRIRSRAGTFLTQNTSVRFALPVLRTILTKSEPTRNGSALEEIFLLQNGIAIKNEDSVGGAGGLDVQHACALQALETHCAGNYFPETVVFKLRLAILARQEDRPHGPLDVGDIVFALGGDEVAARVAGYAGHDVMAAVFNDLSAVRQSRSSRLAFSTNHRHKVPRSVLEIEPDLLPGGQGGLNIQRIRNGRSCGQAGRAEDEWNKFAQCEEVWRGIPFLLEN